MLVHIYNSDHGVLDHLIGEDQDYGGQITVTSDVERLMGWPTLGMRRAVSSDGRPTCWYIGTDAEGNVVHV